MSDFERQYQEALDALNRANSVNCVLERERDEALAQVEMSTLHASNLRLERDEAQAEIERLREVYLHGCECASDEACAFVRERDEARDRNIILRTTIENLHSVITERDAEIARLNATLDEVCDLRVRLARERDEARKETAWLCGLLRECATLLDSEGIPTPARQVMLARIHAALDGLGEERDEARALLREHKWSGQGVSDETHRVDFWFDQIAQLTAERDEARALLRECQPIIAAHQRLAPPDDTLLARLDAALARKSDQT